MSLRNNLPLTARLATILLLIKGGTLADIGTDHAYLPIAASIENKVKTAIACDINPGPLAIAVENIRTFGLEERIETRLGDGLQPVSPGEADCIVISGMGGMRIIDMLKNNAETAYSAGRLILQPQHDVPLVRRMLHEMRFSIDNEIMVKEGGRFYQIIVASPTGSGMMGELPGHIIKWSDDEYLLGKPLIDRKDPVLRHYMEQETRKITRYITMIETENPEPGGAAQLRLSEMRTLAEIYARYMKAFEIGDV